MTVKPIKCDYFLPPSEYDLSQVRLIGDYLVKGFTYVLVGVELLGQLKKHPTNMLVMEIIDMSCIF